VSYYEWPCLVSLREVGSKVLGIGIMIMTDVDPYLVFAIICSFTFVLEGARSVRACHRTMREKGTETVGVCVCVWYVLVSLCASVHVCLCVFEQTEREKETETESRG
jgi:hypothetical protein